MIKCHRGRIKGHLDHELGAFPSTLLKGRDLWDFYLYIFFILSTLQVIHVTVENPKIMETCKDENKILL